MQSALPDDSPSAWGRESPPLGLANAGPSTTAASSSRHVSEYIPSGFPRAGGHGARGASMSNTPGASADLHSTLRSPSFGDGAGGNGASSLLYADSAAVAEWRAMYGASTPMLQATAASFRAGSSGVSFMTPIFHLTAHDSTILSMEHNNHCKLLGIATSKNEILVTWTQLMPVIENMGALRVGEDDLFGGEQAPPLDERLLEWDPATMSILIDELSHPCTELSWAPWQQGIYLAGLCPGHGIRIYRYSHGHWALDDCIRTTESTSCAISKHFTVACACTRGRVELWSRGAAGTGGAGTTTSTGAGGQPGSGASGAGSSSSGSAWVLCRTLTLPITEDEELGGAGGAGGASRGHDGARSSGGPGSTVTGTVGRHRLRDILGVAWDESAALLAVGDQSGAVHVVSVTQDGTRLGDVVFHLSPADGAGPCRQVAWAPSSGRSFLSLAMVFASCVRVVLFRRPRFMSAAGLPHPAHGGRTVNAPHGSGVTGAGGSGATLQVLASALVPCEEVAKLSWNGTGTRFVSSHLDSSVNIWAVDVRYQYQAEAGGSGASRPAGTNTAAHSGEESGRGGHHATSDKRLSLVVSVRRTSSVHPYHAASK